MKMADNILHGLRIVILVTDGFEEVELSDGYAPHGKFRPAHCAFRW